MGAEPEVGGASVGVPGVAQGGKVGPAEEEVGSTAGCGSGCHIHLGDAVEEETVTVACSLRLCCVSSLKAASPETTMNRMCLRPKSEVWWWGIGG